MPHLLLAGIGIEMVRLFQVELEHYEKVEGRMLSLEGKANRLAGLVRANLGGAMQGLVAVPLLAGYDENTQKGRIFSFDVAALTVSNWPPGRFRGFFRTNYQFHDPRTPVSGAFIETVVTSPGITTGGPIPGLAAPVHP